MTNPTFRIVRREVTTVRVNEGMAWWDSHSVNYIADRDGDWIEKDLGDGCKVYRMAVDCNPAAVAKLRAA